jgi:hypothetical protein
MEKEKEEKEKMMKKKSIALKQFSIPLVLRILASQNLVLSLKTWVSKLCTFCGE